MTRVAIIGNSHVGAYMQAHQAITGAFPAVTLSFFALPRHSFASCHYDEAGVLTAQEPPVDGFDDRIDLSDQDHILMVGQSFAIDGISRLIGAFDVLGLQAHGRARSVSLPLLQAFLDHRVGRFCTRLAGFLRNDPRCVVAPRPFAAADAPDPARAMAECARHPEAARLVGLWSDTVARHMAPLNYGLMLQPEALQHGPGHSPPHYARAHDLPDLPDGRAPRVADYTHMNAEYGLAHFAAFAKERLGLLPAAPSPSTERSMPHGLGQE